MLSVLQCLRDIANWCKQFTTTEITSKVTFKKSSGSCNVTNFRVFKNGSIITVWVFCTTTASVGAGANILVGTISSNKPVIDTTSCSYSGSYIVGGSLTAGGTIVIRNGYHAIPSGYGIGMAFNYFLK